MRLWIRTIIGIMKKSTSYDVTSLYSFHPSLQEIRQHSVGSDLWLGRNQSAMVQKIVERMSLSCKELSRVTKAILIRNLKVVGAILLSGPMTTLRMHKANHIVIDVIY